MVTTTDSIIKQFTRSVTNIDRRLRIVENREMPSGGGTGGDGLTQAQADLLYVNVVGADHMQGPLDIGGNVVGRSPDANNFLEWHANGFYINLDPYATDADLAAHVAAPDPHPVYLTQARGDLRYSQLGHTHPSHTSFAYRFSTSTAMADPGAGYLRVNSATPGTATAYAIDAVTLQGTDVSHVLRTLRAGDTIYVQDQDNAANWGRHTLTGPVVDQGGWFQIPIAFVSGSGTVPNNNATLEVVLTLGAGGGGAIVAHTHIDAATGGVIDYLRTQWGTDHLAAADPHSQYATDVDLANHVAAANPHPVYATDADLTAHVGAADPHVGYVLESLIDAKGDLFVGSAADTVARLPVGTNGQFLTAQSGQTSGLLWAPDPVIAHVALGDPHSQYATDTDLTNHAAAPDPHTVYLLQSEGDLRYEQLTRKGQANGYASLDASGLLPTSQLPPLAINETFVVNSQAAMLALTAQRGDMAIRTDNGRTYVLSAEPASVLANWTEVLAAGQVTSVNGQTGVVNLTAANVGAATGTDITNAINAHTALADPHTGYVLESLIDAKGDLYAGTADNTVGRLPVGTNGQFLTAQSGQTTGLQWAANPITAHEAASDPHAGYVLESLLDAKGDIYVATADNAVARQAVGTNGQFLTAQSGQATGLQWAPDPVIAHVALADPHTQYATDTDLANHAAAADPHTVYLTQARGDLRYSLLSHNHDAAYSPIAHNHDAAYVNVGGDSMTGALTISGNTVGVSASAGNTIVWNADGFYAAAGAIQISPDAGNIIQMRANGLYVPMGLLFGRP